MTPSRSSPVEAMERARSAKRTNGMVRACVQTSKYSVFRDSRAGRERNEIPDSAGPNSQPSHFALSMPEHTCGGPFYPQRHPLSQ